MAVQSLAPQLVDQFSVGVGAAIDIGDRVVVVPVILAHLISPISPAFARSVLAKLLCAEATSDARERTMPDSRLAASALPTQASVAAGTARMLVVLASNPGPVCSSSMACDSAFAWF